MCLYIDVHRFLITVLSLSFDVFTYYIFDFMHLLTSILIDFAIAFQN